MVSSEVKALAEKIIEGKALESASIEVDAELEAADMPPPKEWMLRDQKNGKPLGAKEIYEEDYKWAKKKLEAYYKELSYQFITNNNEYDIYQVSEL